MIDMEKLGHDQLRKIKESPVFPFHSGNLKFNATSGQLIDENTYCIKFDSTIAPYIKYLEDGTGPHDIPRAFGRPLPFGIGGRFDGKFHPGSTKHERFIEKLVLEITLDISKQYKGVVKRV